MARRLLITAAAVASAALLLTATGSARGIREGGTLRVGMEGALLPSIDPAFLVARHLLGATCAGVMMIRKRPEGLRLLPEIAADDPTITEEGKTYTFSIRKGVRFSTGAPVTAKSFAYTINRILNPRMIGQYAPSVQPFRIIVGAQDVIDGKAAAASGIAARGNRLVIKLTKPAGDFPVRLAGPSFCVLPENLPIDPEGVKAPTPAAGPYFVSSYLPEQDVVLKRNRFYRGSRPHHADRIVVDLALDAQTILDRVDGGELDLAFVRSQEYGGRAAQFARKYGLNKSRFFVAPGPALSAFHLNTSRPLFRGNLRLRQAVNFAVDRMKLARESGPFGGTPTDQYLTPAVLGFKDANVYPLSGDLARARALAKGHLRAAKAVLLTADDPISVAQAQILQRNLKAIGLTLEIKQFPLSVLFAKLDAGGEPYDIAWEGWILDRDPSGTPFGCFDGRTLAEPGNCNLSHINSPKYNRLLETTSRIPAGPARYRAYAKLDADIAANAAPAIPFLIPNVLTLVSDRVGCVVVSPVADLAGLCPK
jgi:peptide/nickel transport system substrate-binding protein